MEKPGIRPGEAGGRVEVILHVARSLSSQLHVSVRIVGNQKLIKQILPKNGSVSESISERIHVPHCRPHFHLTASPKIWRESGSWQILRNFPISNGSRPTPEEFLF